MSGIKLIPEMNLLSKTKQEQFQYRLQVLDKECRKRGECKICGCQIPQLQMVDEPCEGNCYPPFMSQKDWEAYKLNNNIYVKSIK